ANLNEFWAGDDLLGYGPFLPQNYSHLLTAATAAVVPWRELIINNTVLSVLNTRFVLVNGEQLAAIEQMLGPNTTVEKQSVKVDTNILKPGEWKVFGGGHTDQLTTCPPSQDWCGMNQFDVLLQPNSVYEFSYIVRS